MSKPLRLRHFQQLCALCLKDFPCGPGSWNKPNRAPDWRRSSGFGEQELGGAGVEETETLIEYLNGTLSPWTLEDACGQERGLKEMAVRSHGPICSDFIFKYFTKLRIVDKGVSVVDERLLRFINLEELVLSGNHISEINSDHLPRALKVLELCANEISDMKGLCKNPPPGLQHLGLGYNRLSSVTNYKYLMAAFWPELVSLDLSFSGFGDQVGMMDALATLPSLRCLVLQGAPLTLAPSYPGYTLDSLPRLIFLDDARVSPDERHCFSGLAKKRELIAEEGVVIVKIGELKGIPDPCLEAEKTANEFPFIAYSFLITYEFLGYNPLALVQQTEYESDGLPVSSSSGINYKDQERTWLTVSTHTRGNYRWRAAGPEQARRSQDYVVAGKKPSQIKDSRQESCSFNVDSISFYTAYNFKCVPTTEGIYITQELSGISPKCHRSVPCPDGSWKLFLTIHRTPGVIWTEVMDSEYRAVHRTRDLPALKRFFLRGLQVTVEEQKVLSWPANTGENTGTKPTSGKKGAGKEKEDGKGKPKDKKKKEPQLELIQEPPVRRTLGSAWVALESLLSGEGHIETVCDCGVLQTSQAARPLPAGEKESIKKVKGKGKAKKSNEVEAVTEVAPSQPTPLTVEFTVQLSKWRTTAEA
uniref:Leucine rich repeat containing 43 n=1 Tax=Lepisosteus oculatus TaxID=7918 RepID=W5MDI0_LEPOC